MMTPRLTPVAYRVLDEGELLRVLVDVEARRLLGERRLAEAVCEVELDYRAIGLVQPPDEERLHRTKAWQLETYVRQKRVGHEKGVRRLGRGRVTARGRGKSRGRVRVRVGVFVGCG